MIQADADQSEDTTPLGPRDRTSDGHVTQTGPIRPLPEIGRRVWQERSILCLPMMP